MSREWEESYEARFDENESWLYTRDTRTQDARVLREFKSEDLEPWDDRHGHARLFMRRTDPKYLREVDRVKNSYEGLLD